MKMAPVEYLFLMYAMLCLAMLIAVWSVISSALKEWKERNALKRRIYIAGPMRGIRHFNFEAFDAAKQALEEDGFEVVSPADLDREEHFHPENLPDDYDWSTVPDDFSLSDAIDRDVSAIKTCSHIYMLKGWEASKGATAEKSLADWMGLTVHYQYQPPVIQAARQNSGKPEMSQLHHFRLEALAAHCTAGRLKYPDVQGQPNWRLGGKPDQEYLDAADRHLAKIVRGETYDDETGTMHAAAVAWNMLAMITNNYADAEIVEVVNA